MDPSSSSSYGLHNHQHHPPFFPYPISANYGTLALASNPPPLTSIQVLQELHEITRTNEIVVEEQNGGDPAGSEQEQPLKDPFGPEATIPLPFQLGDEYGYYGPTAIWKRNERERHRVRCVNEGYEKLRNILPLADKDKRLSKVETLRLAIRYIQHLELLMADENHHRICTCNLVPNTLENDDSDNEVIERRQRPAPPASGQKRKRSRKS